MLSLRASDIMTRDVITIHANSTVDEALRLMANHKVSGLPVVDTDGCLKGIITESDLLLKGQLAMSVGGGTPNGLFAPQEDGVAEAYRRSKAHLVEEAMTRRVLTFREESYVSDIARAMIEQAVNRVPIVSDCKVVGIVSRRDVVKALAKESHALGGHDPDELKNGRVFEL
jgi:CBS domain-containing protein